MIILVGYFQITIAVEQGTFHDRIKLFILPQNENTEPFPIKAMYFR